MRETLLILITQLSLRESRLAAIDCHRVSFRLRGRPRTHASPVWRERVLLADVELVIGKPGRARSASLLRFK